MGGKPVENDAKTGPKGFYEHLPVHPLKEKRGKEPARPYDSSSYTRANGNIPQVGKEGSGRFSDSFPYIINQTLIGKPIIAHPLPTRSLEGQVGEAEELGRIWKEIPEGLKKVENGSKNLLVQWREKLNKALEMLNLSKDRIEIIDEWDRVFKGSKSEEAGDKIDNYYEEVIHKWSKDYEEKYEKFYNDSKEKNFLPRPSKGPYNFSKYLNYQKANLLDHLLHDIRRGLNDISYKEDKSYIRIINAIRDKLKAISDKSGPNDVYRLIIDANKKGLNDIVSKEEDTDRYRHIIQALKGKKIETDSPYTRAHLEELILLPEYDRQAMAPVVEKLSGRVIYLSDFSLRDTVATLKQFYKISEEVSGGTKFTSRTMKPDYYKEFRNILNNLDKHIAKAPEDINHTKYFNTTPVSPHEQAYICMSAGDKCKNIKTKDVPTPGSDMPVLIPKDYDMLFEMQTNLLAIRNKFGEKSEQYTRISRLISLLDNKMAEIRSEKMQDKHLGMSKNHLYAFLGLLLLVGGPLAYAYYRSRVGPSKTSLDDRIKFDPDETKGIPLSNIDKKAKELWKAKYNDTPYSQYLKSQKWKQCVKEAHQIVALEKGGMQAEVMTELNYGTLSPKYQSIYELAKDMSGEKTPDYSSPEWAKSVGRGQEIHSKAEALWNNETSGKQLDSKSIKADQWKTCADKATKIDALEKGGLKVDLGDKSQVAEAQKIYEEAKFRWENKLEVGEPIKPERSLWKECVEKARHDVVRISAENRLLKAPETAGEKGAPNSGKTAEAAGDAKAEITGHSNNVEVINPGKPSQLKSTGATEAPETAKAAEAPKTAEAPKAVENVKSGRMARLGTAGKIANVANWIFAPGLLISSFSELAVQMDDLNIFSKEMVIPQGARDVLPYVGTGTAVAGTTAITISAVSSASAWASAFGGGSTLSTIGAGALGAASALVVPALIIGGICAYYVAVDETTSGLSGNVITDAIDRQSEKAVKSSKRINTRVKTYDMSLKGIEKMLKNNPEFKKIIIETSKAPTGEQILKHHPTELCAVKALINDYLKQIKMDNLSLEALMSDKLRQDYIKAYMKYSGCDSKEAEEAIDEILSIVKARYVDFDKLRLDTEDLANAALLTATRLEEFLEANKIK